MYILIVGELLFIQFLNYIRFLSKKFVETGSVYLFIVTEGKPVLGARVSYKSLLLYVLFGW